MSQELDINQIDFDKALKLFKIENPMATITMSDREVVKLFVKVHIPKLVAEKDEFFKILRMF